MTDAASVTVTIDPARLTVRPGEAAHASIRLDNRSADPLSYQLRLAPEARAWAEVFPNQGQIFPGHGARARLDVTPPADMPTNLYPVTVVVHVVGSPAPAADATLTVYVPEPVRETAGAAQAIALSQAIEVTAEPVEDPAFPPPARQWQVGVRNGSDIVDTFVFSTDGLRASRVSFEPVELTLRPGQTGATRLRVRPEAELSGGDYRFVVSVFSVINPQNLTQAPLSFGVGARGGFALTTRPDAVESEGEARFEVALQAEAENNTTLRLDLSAADGADACVCRLEPAEVTLAPGQSVTGRLLVQARAPLSPDERRDHVVTVRAVAAGGVGALSRSATVRLSQRGVRLPTLELSPRLQRGEREARYALRVTNPAGAGTTLQFAGQDDEARLDYRFEPAEIVVPAGGQAETRVEVRARADRVGEAPESITFGVLARRPGSVHTVVQTTGVFVQQPVAPLVIEVIPPSQSVNDRGRARFHIRVQNPRAEPVAVTLLARDQAEALEFAWPNPTLQLMPRGEASVGVTVRPRQPLAPGESRRTLEFTVASEGGAASVGAAGASLLQQRGIDWLGLSRRIVVWAILLLLVWCVLALALDALDQWQLAKFEREGGNPLTTTLGNVVGNPVAQGVRRLPLPVELRGLVQWLVRCQFVAC